MRSVKLAAGLLIVALILGFAGATVAVAAYLPQAAIYVPVLTVGLALALQKYTASFLAYFAITLSGIFTPGDRIRIGNIKGDVRRIGLLHTILEEVGEDEKLGGELTGRILHVPNLIVLDQPVLNYSKDYSVHHKSIASDYMFDEVRIPITPDSNTQRACELLEGILRGQDEAYLREARQMFQNGYPKFLDEAMEGPRVLVYVEPQRIWIKGKFVAPVRGRNDLRSRILLRFIDQVHSFSDVRLA